VIPSAIVKENQITPSTGFILQADSLGISLQYVHMNKNTMPIDQTFRGVNQQALIVKSDS
jgi:hypothetical protein